MSTFFEFTPKPKKNKKGPMLGNKSCKPSLTNGAIRFILKSGDSTKPKYTKNIRENPFNLTGCIRSTNRKIFSCRPFSRPRATTIRRKWIKITKNR